MGLIFWTKKLRDLFFRRPEFIEQFNNYVESRRKAKVLRYNARSEGYEDIRNVFIYKNDGTKISKEEKDEMKEYFTNKLITLDLLDKEIDDQVIGISKWLNKKFQYRTDISNYGRNEYWSSPWDMYEQLINNGYILDDCDGYAVLMVYVWGLIGVPVGRRFVRAGDVYDKSGNYAGGHATACVTKDTIIKTNKGNFPIFKLKKGDFILTHNNNYKKILKIMKRKTKNFLNIRTQSNLKSINITKEHLIYCISRKESVDKQAYFMKKVKEEGKIHKFAKFIESRNLRIGDLLIMPIPKILENNIILFGNEEIKLDFNLGKLFGLFVAEGNISTRFSKNGNIKSRRVRFTLHRKEKSLLKFIINEISKLTNNKYGIYKSKNDKSVCLTFYDTKLGNFFSYLFGEPKNKKINPILLNSNVDFFKGLVYGWYLGDGYKYQKHITITSSSKKLSETLHEILRFLKINYSITIIPEKNTKIKGKYYLCQEQYDTILSGFDLKFFKTNKSNQRTFYINDYYVVPITKIEEVEKEEEFVYNLEVEKDNSYVANNLAIHNCYWNERYNEVFPIEGSYYANDINAEYEKKPLRENELYGDVWFYTNEENSYRGNKFWGGI